MEENMNGIKCGVYFYLDGKRVCVGQFDSDYQNGIPACKNCSWRYGNKKKSIYLEKEIKDKKNLEVNKNEKM